MRRTSTRLLVPVVAAMALSLAVGCDDSTPASTTPASPTQADEQHPRPTATVTALPALTAAQLTQLCQSQFAVDPNGSTVVNHRAWGPTTVVACGPTSTSAPVDTAGILAADLNGKVVWSLALTDLYYELKVANPGTDSSGNVFVMYNPGRYDGVIVLRPTPTSIDVLVGTASGEGDPVTSLDFYSAYLSMVSGMYEVTVRKNDCDPDCADGTPSSTTYTWNGTTYVAG
ncbi:MAG: hypothetical protein FWF02_11450 [Micrococcales bacterium]|nr:hypothetical protein [Micrococcales bacterium]MCL2668302.1 hypothetical protein [Micrococcales bacterium]